MCHGGPKRAEGASINETCAECSSIDSARHAGMRVCVLVRACVCDTPRKKVFGARGSETTVGWGKSRRARCGLERWKMSLGALVGPGEMEGPGDKERTFD